VARSAATPAGAGPLSAVAALAEVARLQRELEWMTRQRDILKKAMAIVSQEPRNTSK
jgi:transposase-like protein